MPIKAENKKLYPDDWQEISDRIRFGRAEWRCECLGECGRGHAGRCEARHNRPHPATGSMVILTTAHLDHTPQNVDEANLRAMCQACHLTYDAKHHAQTAARTRAAKLATWMDQLPGLEVAA